MASTNTNTSKDDTVLSTDIYEISEAQRKEIYSQSNFRELEEILEKIEKWVKEKQNHIV